MMNAFEIAEQGFSQAQSQHLLKQALDDIIIVRSYIARFSREMSTAELIGAYRKLIDLGQATDAEECALLDLINPWTVK